MKNLTALSIIPVGTLAADSKEISVGQSFEAPDDFAFKLIAEGQAEEAVAEKIKTVAVRVLTASEYGDVNDVIDLPVKHLRQAKASGLVDDEKASVAYAMNLKKPVK